VGEQGVVLEHHADVAAVDRLAPDVLAIDPDLAGIGLDEAGNGAQQRGLAAAARPQQAEELAFADLQRDAVQRDDGFVALGDADDVDRAHRLFLSARR
jgi:hypothetical protein